jgi:CheY-like chemotaxis protein/ligand-binding sensor domain-containing protein/nitrogen-specific signal transduction histidine kinase
VGLWLVGTILFSSCEDQSEFDQNESALRVSDIQATLSGAEETNLVIEELGEYHKMDTLVIGTDSSKQKDLTVEYVDPIKTIGKLGKPVTIDFGNGVIPAVEKKKLGAPVISDIVPQVTDVKPLHREVNDEVTFFELGLEQGLNSQFITSIFEDSRGYKWLGSRRGISKFDGYNFNYYQLVNDAEHRMVGGICEDQQGNIWMSFSAHGGLMMFDGVQFFEYTEGEALNIGEQYLGIIGTDVAGNIWLKGHSKIIRMNGEDLTIFPYQFQDLTNLNVIMREGQEGEVWLSALGGVCSVIGDKMTYHAVEEFDERNLCHPILIDEGEVWTSTGTGVTKIQDDSLVVYRLEFVKNNDIRNCLSLGNDFILVSESKNNAFCFLNEGRIEVKWQSGSVFTGARPLFVDEQKNVWLSEYGAGVIRYNPYGLEQYKFEHLTDGGPTSALLEDDHGNIWFGAHGEGVIKFDGEYYTSIPLPNTGLHCAVRTLSQDASGVIWIGTAEQGCFSIREVDNQGFEVTYHDFFGQPYGVYALESDQNGEIWIGTKSHGMLKLDPARKAFAISTATSDGEIPFVRSIIEVDGAIWAGSQARGLYRIAGDKVVRYTAENGLTSDHVVSLFQDTEGKIWAGHQDGGVSIVKENKVWKISMEEGLSSNAVWSIVEDANQHIWIGADNMLNVVFNGGSFSGDDVVRIKTFNELGGLMGGEFYANAVIRDRENNLWWGTDQFATKIESPENYTSSLEQPDLQLSEVKLINNHINYGELKGLKDENEKKLIGVDDRYDVSQIIFEEVVPYTNCPVNLELPADFNDITFEYGVLNHTHASEVKFSFLLPGVDKEWTEPSASNKISYHGIPAGKYTLLAKASSVNGVWSEPVTYSFSINPVWYKTTLAKIVWVVLCLGLVLLVVWVIHNRRKEKLATEAAKRTVQLKSELYSNVTHEFRTPLTLIMGMTDRIKGNDQEKEVILQNSGKLLQHVNQLLDIAKSQSGLQILNLIQADVVSVLRVNVEYFRMLAESKGLNLTFYSEVDRLVMDFDEEKIQQVVYNLLSNAIKYTPAGGSVIFHVAQLTDDGSLLQLKVKDTGVGIAAEDQKKVFQRFYQTENTAEEKGSGIGLFLTKEFVDLMKGAISLESKPGVGTTFEIRLPITNEAVLLSDEIVVESDTTEADEVPKVKDDTKLEILVIEDNQQLGEFIVSLFGEKYAVKWAKDGVDGVQLATETIPDAVISDIAMPRMDGYEVCEVLKSTESTSHIPIILLTAKVEHEDKMKGLNLGADAYLTKPFRKDELLLRIEKLIESRKQLQTKFAIPVTSQETSKQDDPETQFLNKLVGMIQDNIGDTDFSVPQLAGLMGLSQMQLYRKLKALVDQTPTAFIRKYRLEKGKSLLKTTTLSISEIAYEVGFSDPNYFSRVFHKEFGGPPNQFRD